MSLRLMPSSASSRQATVPVRSAPAEQWKYTGSLCVTASITYSRISFQVALSVRLYHTKFVGQQNRMSLPSGDAVRLASSAPRRFSSWRTPHAPTSTSLSAAVISPPRKSNPYRTVPPSHAQPPRSRTLAACGVLSQRSASSGLSVPAARPEANGVRTFGRSLQYVVPPLVTPTGLQLAATAVPGAYSAMCDTLSSSAS